MIPKVQTAIEVYQGASDLFLFVNRVINVQVTCPPHHLSFVIVYLMSFMRETNEFYQPFASLYCCIPACWEGWE